MALSDQERSQCRKYCGYMGRFKQLDVMFEAAMDNLDNEASDEAEVRAELARCRTVDTKIDQFVMDLALVQDTGGTKTRAYYALTTLRSIGRQAVGRICTILGCERRADSFSTRGPSPDEASPALTEPAAKGHY